MSMSHQAYAEGQTLRQRTATAQQQKSRPWSCPLLLRSQALHDMCPTDLCYDPLFKGRHKDNQNESSGLVLLRQELQDVFLSMHGLHRLASSSQFQPRNATSKIGCSAASRVRQLLDLTHLEQEIGKLFWGEVSAAAIKAS